MQDSITYATPTTDPLTNSELRKKVQKDSDDSLVAELKRGQAVLDPAFIDAMSRDTLIDHVVTLRLAAGQSTSVKSQIPTFRLPTGATSLGATAADHTSSPRVKSLAVDSGHKSLDPMVMLVQLQMQAAEERREERKLEAERLRIMAQEVNARELEHQRLLGCQNRLLAEANKDATQRHVESLKRADLAEQKAVADGQRIENRLQRASALMKNILFPMPSYSGDLPLYFENVDKLFALNSVDNDLRIALLGPYLTDKARKVMLILPPEDIDTYIKWKAALLKEHRLTPQTYRRNFVQASREPDESCQQFSTRLACLLKYYLQSQDINNSFEELVSLLLADRLRDSLPFNTKTYVADKEGEGWFKSSKIANIVDIFEETRGRENKSRTDTGSRYNDNPERSRNRNTFTNTFSSLNSQTNVFSKPVDQNKDSLKCYKCNKTGHYANSCLASTNDNRHNRAQSLPPLAAPRKTRACFICNSIDHLQRSCPQNKTKPYKHVRKVAVLDLDQTEDNTRRPVCKSTHTTPKTLMTNRVELISQPIKEMTHLESSKVNYTIRPTDELIVQVDFGNGPTDCLVDSGAEISVLKSSMISLDSLSEESIQTSVTLQGAFGDVVKAKLMNVTARLLNVDSYSKRRSPLLLTCAVTEELHRDVALLSLCDYEVLRQGVEEFIPEVKLLCNTSMMYTDPRLTHNQDSVRIENLSVCSVDNVSIHRGDKLKTIHDDSNNLGADLQRVKSIDDYRKLQLDDLALKPCFKLASVKDSGFRKHIDNGLLFHDKMIGGFLISRLVLPKEKHLEVIKAAHDSDWAMHFGLLKTTQRIEAHFYWPSMKSDISSYVKSCIP